MAVTQKEKLEAERQKLLERKKELEAALKKNSEKEREITRREETTMGMSFWRFFVKFKPEDYEAIIKSKEFGEYLTSAYSRKLFGFSELPQVESKRADSLVYLNASYEEREEVKALGARWDDEARKWYVPEGLSTDSFSRWLSAPAGSTNHEEEFRQEPENADL